MSYLRILLVCTHNRARSVVMAAQLRPLLAARGVHAHLVGAGFVADGEPATAEITAALAHVGLDASGHRSRLVDATTVEGADVVIAAERVHVMRLCEDRMDVFARTFTLPEVVLRGEAVGPRHGAPFDEWLARVGAGRTPASFLEGAVPEIVDPTGSAPVVIAASVSEIGDWCRRLAVLL